ncbi:MAG: hypothetical protein ACOZIN_04450, partial [Myxococcota bacterium]
AQAREEELARQMAEAKATREAKAREAAEALAVAEGRPLPPAKPAPAPAPPPVSSAVSASSAPKQPSAPAPSSSARSTGLGLRLLYVPEDQVIGPALELALNNQSGASRTSVVLTAYPGPDWGFGASARLGFGPSLSFGRFELGFDIGMVLVPTKLILAYEGQAHLLGFSFPAGPVRLVLRLASVGLYGTLTTEPMVMRGAVSAGMAVEY